MTTSYSGGRGWHSLSCRLETHKHAIDEVQQGRSFCKLWQMIKFKFIIYCNLHRFEHLCPADILLLHPGDGRGGTVMAQSLGTFFSCKCCLSCLPRGGVPKATQHKGGHQAAKHPPPRCGGQWRAGQGNNTTIVQPQPWVGVLEKSTFILITEMFIDNECPASPPFILPAPLLSYSIPHSHLMPSLCICYGNGSGINHWPTKQLQTRRTFAIINLRYCRQVRN